MKEITELWLFKGTAEQKTYRAEFVGVKTREELICDYGYPAKGKAHGGKGGDGGGERRFDASGAADFACYATVGDTTLYASWSDTPGFDAADYRLDITGMEIGDAQIAISVAGKTADKRDYAIEFAKVRSSPTLPIPMNGPATPATLETLENGAKALLLVPFDPSASSMFYRIDVGE